VIGVVGFGKDMGASRNIFDPSASDTFKVMGEQLSEAIRRVLNPLRRYMTFLPVRAHTLPCRLCMKESFHAIWGGLDSSLSLSASPAHACILLPDGADMPSCKGLLCMLFLSQDTPHLNQRASIMLGYWHACMHEDARIAIVQPALQPCYIQSSRGCQNKLFSCTQTQRRRRCARVARR
jgi:hypothetical protein